MNEQKGTFKNENRALAVEENDDYLTITFGNYQNNKKGLYDRALSALRAKKVVCVQAFFRKIMEAVKFSEIIKERIGMVHQETSFISLTSDEKGQRVRTTPTCLTQSGRKSFLDGICIKLCLWSKLDQEWLGYQKPKPSANMLSRLSYLK